jgi:Amt family ammonium transporter
VSTTSAIYIGIAAGLVCYAAIRLKKRMQWDDALDVWGVHGVGGLLGVTMLGLFATTAVNVNGANGLLAGNAPFFLRELASVVGCSLYAFLFSYGALWLINRISPVKVSAEEEAAGLDAALHGELAYGDE